MNREGERGVLPPSVIVPILLLAAAPVLGGVNRWTASGPEGGSIAALVVSPASPQVLYAGTHQSGVFKSEDRAATWVPTARFPEGRQTSSLAIDPTTAATVYAGTEKGVLKTIDGGTTWTALPFPASSAVLALMIDPRNPSTLYAGVFDSPTPVFKSNDAGRTWFAASDGLPSHSAPSLAMDPSNPSSLFFATGSSSGGGNIGVFASTDGGTHWKLYNALNGARAVAIDPSPPATLYVGTFNGVLKSVGGGTWQTTGLFAGSANTAVYSIAIDPSAAGRIYAATASGTYRSEDHAQSWRPINQGFPGSTYFASRLVFDPLSSSTIYAATEGGVFKSASRGENWTRSTTGIRAAYVPSIAVACGPGCGAARPFTSQTIYAGMSLNGVARSDDGGRTWTSVDPDRTPPAVNAVVSLPSDSRTVLAGTSDGGIYRSRDAGVNWTKMSQDLAEVLSFAADPSAPSRLFAGGESGVARSQDGGDSWELTTLVEASFDYPPVFGALGIATSNPQVVYTAADQFFRSVDAGERWVSTGNLSGYARVLAIDPLSASTVYVATYDNGILKSVDAGNTFRQLGGLPASYAWSVVTDPSDSSTIYAGAEGNGIIGGLPRPPGLFRSLDGGETWAPFDHGLEGKSVLSLAIDRSGGRLYAGTYSGLFHYEIVTGSLDLSVGPDGSTTLLVDTSTGEARLTSLDRLGFVSGSGPYGPYEGWTAQATASGADGLTRVLWNNEDGSAALWLLAAGQNQASYRLDPIPGWTVVDVAAGVAGSTDILRVRADGALAIFHVDNLGQVTAGPTNGPYASWAATAIADGLDGLTRVLWNKVDGTAAISLMQSGNLLSTRRYGPAAGWTASDIAVGADGQARLLWTHADGRLALWRVDEAGNPTVFGPIYDPPAGFTATRVSTGADGLTRILWNSAEGSSKIWLMLADNIFLQSFDIGPN